MLTAEEKETTTLPSALPTSQPRGDQLSAPDKETADGEASQRSFVQRVTGLLVTGLGLASAGVTAATRGRGTPPPPEEDPANDGADIAALNLLWFTLSAMMVTLVGGLAWLAYLGPLRSFLLHDALVSLLAVASGVLWVRMFRTLASEGIIGRKLSRKLIHITSAPLFLLCWPLYSDSAAARCVAALPPLANALRLLNTGLGKTENPDAVQAISREGGRKELLQGPLYYVLVLLAATVLGWRSSLASYVSICLMAGGDGLADIVGRRFGTVKLPWNPNKSWAGSLAMFLGGFAMSTAFAWLFGYAGYLPPLASEFFIRLAGVCLVTTAIESVPTSRWWPLDDNVSVPLVAVVSSTLLFHTV